jgi:serine/threonine protein kinase
MVLEKLGESVSKIQDKTITNCLSLKDTIRVGLEMIDALETLHEKGYTHGDIKPDNFLTEVNRNEAEEKIHGLQKIHLIDMGRA